MSRLGFFAMAVLTAACAAPAPEPVQEATGPADWQEGAWEYLPPLHGLAVAHEGRFVFLFGPSDGSQPMSAEAGTYVISGDTVRNTVRFSTDTTWIGEEYSWTLESLSGDTLSFVVMDTAGVVIQRARTLIIR